MLTFCCCRSTHTTEPVFNSSTPFHGVFHWIPTHSPPVWAHPQCLCPETLCVLQEEFAHLQQLGIICPLHCEWASPLHMAPRGNCEWRPDGNYRCLNLCSVPNQRPILDILDFTLGLVGAQIFSKIDLIRGYHQIPLHLQDIHKTAITMPFGLCEFLQMLFSLSNVSQTFQHLMNDILQRLPFISSTWMTFLWPAPQLLSIYSIYARYLIGFKTIASLLGLKSVPLVSQKFPFLGTLSLHPASNPFQ